MNIGFKFDNCADATNQKYVEELLNELKENQPIEIGLECYSPRGFDNNSTLIKNASDKLRNHKNKIVHLTLKAKLLNISAYTQEEWNHIWLEQYELVENINPSYLIVHPTSHESKIYSEEEQIKNIHSNFCIVEGIFERPIFIENTYEDLPFYEKLFLNAPASMNFVFDIGHMKIHSTKSRNEWIDFLLKLKESNRRIHFHIHDNNSVADEHKPLTEVNSDVYNFVEELLNLFPDSNFILESHSPDFIRIKKDYELLTSLSIK